jgi:tellurite resistance protein TerC
MLEVTAAGWAATVGLIGLLLTVDLFVSGRRPHAVGFREAVAWSVFYIAVALLFGAVFGFIAGWQFGAQYFAGYAVEKSLSVDNLFVFVIIMSSFAVPPEHQQKVLTIGIVLALVLRAAFIAIGAAMLAAFSFMFLLFGLLLIGTAVQLFRHRDQDPSVEDNALVAVARRRLPLSDGYDAGRIVTRVDGRRVLTPLFLVLLAIGTSDILFALDSIPAIFGVSREAFIVFAANAFALLGLRALYFLVSGLLDRLVYLSTGLAIILAFIGAKLILHYLHLQSDAVPEISTPLSLLVIGVVLAVTTIASLIKARRDPSARAHAGSLRQHPHADADARDRDNQPVA